jgi:hypothetical protein
MQKMEGKLTNFMLTFDQLEKIDKIKDDFGVTRSQCVRDLVNIGLDIVGFHRTFGSSSLKDIRDENRALYLDKYGPRLF